MNHQTWNHTNCIETWAGMRGDEKRLCLRSHVTVLRGFCLASLHTHRRIRRTQRKCSLSPFKRPQLLNKQKKGNLKWKSTKFKNSNWLFLSIAFCNPPSPFRRSAAIHVFVSSLWSHQICRGRRSIHLCATGVSEWASVSSKILPLGQKNKMRWD